MSAQHTPGPWSCAGAYGRYGRSIIGPDGENIGHVQTDRPARRNDAGHGETEPLAHGEANARLIAAAPDLLAALRGIVDALGGECFDWGPARAAIAKATGGAA